MNKYRGKIRSSKATSVQWDGRKIFSVCYSMQAIFKNEDKGRYSGRTGLVDILLHTRRISRYLEGEYIGEFEVRKCRV